MRRLIQLLTMLFVLLVGTAGPVMAALSGGISSPTSSGTLITATTDLAVTVSSTRGCWEPSLLICDDKPSEVVVALRRGDVDRGQTALVEEEAEECEVPCDDETVPDDTVPDDTVTWGGKTVNATGAPFQVDCNGQYVLEAFLNGSSDRFGPAVDVNFQQPPAPPKGVAASGEVGNVTVTWTAVTDPNVFAIGVSRKANGAKAFTPLVSPSDPLAPEATSFVDTTVTAADLPVLYAVALFRHDGKVEGEWVEACTDSATALDQSYFANQPALWSAATAQAQVIAPSPSPTGSPSPTESPTAAPSGEPTTPTPRPAPPPEQPTIDLPDRPAAPEPRYYGDNLGFDELLDFGDTPPVTADGLAFDSGDGEVAIDVDAAGQGVNAEDLLEPFAMGLLLVSVAMHVRRWMNA